jgi:folate-binding protein YgfZ
MNRIGKRCDAIQRTYRASTPGAQARARPHRGDDLLRAIALSGADWRSYLQGLVTQDVETLAPGELRFAALLTPQGRLLFDLFLLGREDGCIIDCAAEHRAALLQRLKMYRLRAKVEIAEDDAPVAALWGADAAPAGWSRDPRAPALGFRGYGAAAPAGAVAEEGTAYEAHRLALGVPGPADWGHDKSYPIEANFDLLGGIDFKKGCFVGQETTSRMKRRGTIKNRMAPIAVDGQPPPAGARLLAGALRAGEVSSSLETGAMALLRLDRLGEGPLTLEDGRPWRVLWPAWMAEDA